MGYESPEFIAAMTALVRVFTAFLLLCCVVTLYVFGSEVLSDLYEQIKEWKEENRNGSGTTKSRCDG